MYLVCHLAHFNFPHHMLCCVLLQILSLPSYRAALEMMEGRRNPKLYYPPIQFFVLDQPICFHLLCPELPSNKTILTIFSLISLSHYVVISLREGNSVDKKLFVKYNFSSKISALCCAADFQVVIQLAHLLQSRDNCHVQLWSCFHISALPLRKFRPPLASLWTKGFACHFRLCQENSIGMVYHISNLSSEKQHYLLKASSNQNKTKQNKSMALAYLYLHL